MSSLLKRTLAQDNMRRAWNAIAANDGAAGADHVSIKVWRRTWEARLVDLAHAVRSNTYRPGRLRRRRIPKSNGVEWRVLHIPTITDRILQRAVLQQLHPIFEPRFLNCSYGYRPERSLHDAVRQITRLRKAGLTWVLDADIDDFFNQVHHDTLRRFLRADLPDQSLLRLIDLWIEDPALPAPGRGIPMGAPISPLLANVYLHRLDEALAGKGFALVRYADDFVVQSASRRQARRSYAVVEGVLDTLSLRYEPQKTRLTTFDEGFDFLGVHFEESWYWYIWESKRIEVRDADHDWLLIDYGPDY